LFLNCFTLIDLKPNEKEFNYNHPIMFKKLLTSFSSGKPNKIVFMIVVLFVQAGYIYTLSYGVSELKQQIKGSIISTLFSSVVRRKTVAFHNNKIIKRGQAQL